MLPRFSRIIFWLICLVTFSVIVLKLWILKPLYLDQDLRSRVQEMIHIVAEKEGWLLSGVSIDHLDQDSVRLLYRSHLRGDDPISCYTLSLTSDQLLPCSDS